MARFSLPRLSRPARRGAGRSRPVVAVIAGAVVLALALGAFFLWPRQEPVRISADFVRAVGLFPGSDVRILGVSVGTVLAVEPRGDRVRVELEFTPEHPVPANATAANGVTWVDWGPEA